MWETSARLLKLLSLLQARRDWSGADLAARLEVSERTVRRDVERLRDLGYPVHASRGTDGGYRLGAGAAMPPLLLDDDEAVAVAVGLRTAARSPVTGIEETSVRALAKLENILPSRLRRRVSALADYTVPIPPDSPAPPVDPTVLTTLASACRDHERLRLRLPVSRRHGHGPLGRAAPPGLLGPQVVPGRLGHRTRRLAHVPSGPDRAAHPGRSPVHAPRTARGRRRCGVRGPQGVRGGLPVRGSDHRARSRRGGRRPHQPGGRRG
jgi:biotin operon repressor